MAERPPKQKEDYLFSQMKKKYEEEEEKLVNKVKATRKDPLVSKEELEELSNKLKEIKEKNEEEAVKSKQTLEEIWRNRSQSIPDYKGPFYNKEINFIEDENSPNSGSTKYCGATTLSNLPSFGQNKSQFAGSTMSFGSTVPATG